jgi:integrase
MVYKAHEADHRTAALLFAGVPLDVGKRTQRRHWPRRARPTSRRARRRWRPRTADQVVQARLGHASIQMTADVYGHLFPRGDYGAEMAAAEQALLA